ncbi:MAG: ATP-grasp domain-containing protein [Brevibacillus sp.]|nr:ATP-grasp domain-containing protein [Brevibacillus sp.]
MRFYDQLRQALTGSDHPVRLVWLANFEVEHDWRRNDLLALPSVTNNQSQRVNDSMSELALMLAGPDDAVLVKQEPDEAFLLYLTELGWKPPLVITAAENDLPLVEAHLHQRSSKKTLRAWAKGKTAYLLPHGVSSQVEKLSRTFRVPLAAASGQVSAFVNNKLFSRRLCDQAGIRQPRGAMVRSLDELEQAFQEWKGLLTSTPLLLKEGTGVSGKGMVLIENENRFAQIMRLLRRAAEKQGTERLELVLEEWIVKSADINYQFLLRQDGSYVPLHTLQALVDHGKHVGHLHPHQLPPPVTEEIEQTIPLIAQALTQAGYYGMVGVDALLSKDGRFHPCLEINARLNMSSYHIRAFEEWIPAGRTVIARSFSLKLSAPLSFRWLREKLNSLLFTRDRGRGVLINAFAPVNALHQNQGVFAGRLYAMLVGTDREDSRRLQSLLVKTLGSLGAAVQGWHGDGS